MTRKPPTTPTVVASFALILAACGQSATPTALPTAPATTPRATTTAVSTAPTTPTATATPEPLAALELLWEGDGTPSSTDPLAGTYGPAVDPISGDIWVAASMADVLWVFSPDGTFERSFGGPGDGRGEFELTRPACRDCPGAGAIAFAADGSLFVADVGNHRVQKFDPGHEFELEWGGFGAEQGRFADILAISIVDDEVHVYDDVRGDVQVFDLEGTFLRISEYEDVPAVDAAGNLHVFESDSRIHGYRPDGTEFQSIAVPPVAGTFPIGLAVADDGRLFVNLQDEQTANAVAVAEIDPESGAARLWQGAGENLAIAGDVLYQSNYVSDGWPEAVLRAYRLPAR
jgi:sugar lactone lactonase YvrE